MPMSPFAAVVSVVLLLAVVAWTLRQACGPPPSDAKRHKLARKMARRR